MITATLKMTHKSIGVEVRRGSYDIVVDGQRAGSLEMNDTIEIPVGPGRHTVQVRSGRNSSRMQTFDAAESQTVAFRCTGKSFLPIFLASFVVQSLALQLRRVVDDRTSGALEPKRHQRVRLDPIRADVSAATTMSPCRPPDVDIAVET